MGPVETKNSLAPASQGIGHVESTWVLGSLVLLLKYLPLGRPFFEVGAHCLSAGRSL